ncbi:MAG: hypothetical protein JNK06_07305 [Candidatus Accumulibacter phosphatis]|uniref:hypothetical protein n=1 Tax=Candidatus Accumulibacter phosphatis TaxID=327160 RepID=UPI001A38583A|nr:hypothetical protein [Candidatus Accumulibacter phosphatis]
MTQDDHVIVEHLALEIAELQAENNREQWSENDGDDDMRKTVATTLAKIGFDEAGISGVRPLLLEMIERGVISVRSVLFDLPPGKKTDISADMEGWYMSRADAKKVRDYLLPGKKETQGNTSTAPSGTTEKAAPDVATDGAAEGDAITPAERRANHDMTNKRGARRAILEAWGEIEKCYGPAADGVQVLRVLKRMKDDNSKPWVLKTVRNRLIELRKEKLIPG